MKTAGFPMRGLPGELDNSPFATIACRSVLALSLKLLLASLLIGAAILSVPSCMMGHRSGQQGANVEVEDGPVAGPSLDVLAAAGGPAGGSTREAGRAPRADDPLSAAAAVPGEPRDAWERIRFSMTIVPVGHEVGSLSRFQREMRKFHGSQYFFDRVGERARPWLHHVAAQLEARGMPGELALLPAVESGYKTGAVSSRRAAGVWQIHPRTGRLLNLKHGMGYDGWRDVPDSTRAALDYLQQLHDEFAGDWLLAVAAYNCGPGKVRRAIRRSGETLETAAYPAIERYLPRETRSHVVRWLVLSEIVAQPRLHKVRLEPVPSGPHFAEVEAPPRTRLDEVARLAGVPVSEVVRLNPGFIYKFVAPGGPHRVLLPVASAERFRRELPALRASLRAQASTGPLASSGGAEERYRIRAGDTLSGIALVHGTTVEALMDLNRLSSHHIQSGRELLVPAARREG